MRVGAVAVVVLVHVALAGCGTPSAPRGAAPPSPSVSTLSPLPMPSIGPPPGELVADLRQSSRDAALDRFQVWIGNGLRREVDPTSIRYVDPRFPAPIPGERLRPDPAGSERGYPLALPDRPVCPAPRDGAGRVVMTYAGRRVSLPVEDEADVVARYVATRCFELAVARVARVSFADRVSVDRPGEGAVGRLVLVVRPSGRSGPSGPSGGELRIDSVAGTPLLTAADRAAWTPGVSVSSDDPPRRIGLPVVPARCDDHAFMESGGATAFLVRLHLDGEAGELVVRMSPEGASNVIGFARDSCGLS